MTWRGTTDAKDRFFAALVYVLPLISALEFGEYLFRQFPIFSTILIPLAPFIWIYRTVPLAGIIIFFVLFLAVVRNERINHFIRFNTMQAILIDILILLVNLLLGVLLPALGGGIFVETIYNVVFLGTLAASFYSIVQSILGRYAEI
ncbi:MAG: Tic20 family protein, partial [Xenococcaceae cyanobacterium]